MFSLLSYRPPPLFTYLGFDVDSLMLDSVMIEFKTESVETEVGNNVVEDDDGPPIADGKVSLTKLWEIIVRTNRLPDEFDIKGLFTGFRERLCDPEKEVRQHALRVLSDLIPLLDTNTLDENMQLLLPEIVTNLGYSAPSVRKSAIDCLKVYLKYTDEPDTILKNLVSRGVENASVNEVPVNTVLGIIMSLPHLIMEKMNDDIVQYTIDQLFTKASQILFQETALKSLLRIRKKIGCDKFNSFLEEKMHEEFHNLCEVYNLHDSPEAISGGSSREGASWSDSRSDSGNSVEDKVILETEIKLNSGSAITMKIHEESRPNSANGNSDSDEDARHGSAVVRVLSDSEQEYYESKRTPRRVHFGGEIVKMRTPESDSNQPSDDNDTIIIERGSSIHITVRDGVSSVKTKTRHTHKSFIPIKIKNNSEPSTPRKKPLTSRNRLHKSAPELSTKYKANNTKIPMRYTHSDRVRSKREMRKGDPEVCVRKESRDKIPGSDSKSGSKKDLSSSTNSDDIVSVDDEKKKVAQKESSKPSDHLKVDTTISRPRRGSRSEDNISPKPVHNEIELLHNLMRSPVPTKKEHNIQRENEIQQGKVGVREQIENKKEIELQASKIELEQIADSEVKTKSEQTSPPAITYNSFTIYPGSSVELFSSKEDNSSISEPGSKTEESTQAIVHKGADEEDPQPKSDTKSSETQKSGDKNAKDESLAKKEVPEGRKEEDKSSEPVHLAPTASYTSFKVCTDESKETPDEEKDLTSKVASREHSSRPDSRCDQKKTQRQHEDANVLEPSILNDLCCKEDISARSRGLENLIMSLKWPETCPSLDTAPALLLLHVLFSCEQQLRLQSQAQEALHVLLSNLSHDVLKNCLKQVVHGLSKMGSPDGIRLAILVMQRVTPSIFIRHLVSENHHRNSSKAREGTLQLLIAACRTFPSCDIDVTRGTQLTTKMLKDRKRRVRQAALETLACLAQVSSNADVLDIAVLSVQDWSDEEAVLQVIRTRLSRRQLPLVDGNGNVRYTTPREQIESDWLSNGTINNSQPVDDSVIQHKSQPLNNSDNNNYWKHHSRKNVDALITSESVQCHSDSDWSDGQKDKSLSDSNAQIWAIDPSGFPGQNKFTSVSNGKLRPLYIVQPEVFNKDKSTSLEASSNNNHVAPMTYRKYDRGRSFSPSKDTFRQHTERHTNSSQEVSESLLRRNRRMAKHKDVLRKSFSSEQLYSNTHRAQEGYSFSLSSGSSSTSTGSSSRKGTWCRDFRSSIPIPIHPDHKLKLRVSRNQATLTTPLIAQDPIRREKIPSSRNTPILCRVSPVKQHPPSPPGGSESSGYVTPPAEQQLNDQPFIRLDSDDQSEVDNAHPDDDFQLIETIECEIETTIVTKTGNVERKSSLSSSNSSVDPVAQEEHEEDNESDHEHIQLRLRRESTSSSLKENVLGETPRSFTEHRNKSKSEVDLKTSLPDIANRKNINSAPTLNKSPDRIYTFEQLPVATPKLSLPGSIPTHDDEEPEEVVVRPTNIKEVVKDCPSARLSRRLSKRQMLVRRSSKSSRSEPGPPPSSSRPFSKPREMLQDVLHQLESGDWEITMRGLQGLIRAARHHPEAVESQIHNVCIALARHIKNLRSQVARSACVAATELFTSCKKGLDMEMEELVGPLLQRTADTNKFLRNDANVALDAMAQNLPIHRVIHVIANRGCSHQNGVVRAASIRILSELAHRLGPERVYNMPRDVRDRLLVCGATALTEGSLECRKHGKNMLSLLSSHPHFQKSLLDAVPPHILRHIGKTLKSLK